jgi:hypothetical protein
MNITKQGDPENSGYASDSTGTPTKLSASAETPTAADMPRNCGSLQKSRQNWEKFSKKE